MEFYNEWRKFSKVVNSEFMYMYRRQETAKILIEYLRKGLLRMQILPIGSQDFVQLRQDNLLYVDKTARLLELIKNGCRYFLSHPRRFGKSLTLSILDAMFSGRKELFIGLVAEQWVAKQSENPSSVLRFDMSTIAATTSEDIKLSLQEMIYRIAEDFNLNINS